MARSGNREAVADGADGPGLGRDGVALHDVRAIVGDSIRSCRKSLRLSQKALAELTGLGSRRIISQMEHGDRDVAAAELVRLGRALHVSVGVLLGAAESGTPAQVLWRHRSVS